MKKLNNQGEFYTELRALINKYSLENGSDAPDFIIADYLINCLQVLNETAKNLDKFYNFNHSEIK
ncbi:MAG: hypothetical protein ABIJ97_11650 [Bacteroidota bacterium]